MVIFFWAVGGGRGVEEEKGLGGYVLILIRFWDEEQEEEG